MRTPITYYGGKQLMAKRIVEILPAHKIYCEPFFGGGAVFFEKDPSYLEVINDNNNRLINFYLQLRDNFDELTDLIESTFHSEALYKLAKDIYNSRIEFTPVQLAWSVWVTTNISFSGSIHGGWKWCNGSQGSHTGRYVRKKRNEFELFHDRLKDVQISSRDALRIISDRDTPETVFYLDPPYPGSYMGHYKGYTMRDFYELLQLIQNIDGKFILSNFWSQTLKNHINKNNWYFEAHEMSMKVSNLSKNAKKTELLICNFIPAAKEKIHHYEIEFNK